MDESVILAFLSHGVLDWSAWQIVACTLALTHVTIAAVTIYLHRCQAHRALTLHPLASHFFRFWLWLTTGMVTAEWVAVHRKHHARCEADGDPHSPAVFGIRRVLLEGSELYRIEAANAATVAQYGTGTPSDWIERHVYGRWTWQGVGLMLVIDVVLFGVVGLTVWAVQMLWIPITAAGVVNGLGHWWGYRNYDGPHAATNIGPLGLLIGGEELHNNHHTYPTSAKLSARWFEFDVGWLYIRLLQACRLAQVTRVVPRARRAVPKAVADLHTLQAIIANRHEVMARYRRMLCRAFRAARSDMGADKRSLAQVYRLLRRDPAFVTGEQAASLAHSLRQHSALWEMQQLRAELAELWQRKHAQPEELLAHLRQWCEQAERSGITILRDFATRLRSYA
ncbi:stearoyl-CoA desaturase (delta-9 desaturase) [Pseudoduganella flava]|uniref:Acyl-CoA desaturase n=1 Tax=Pseudoduganella flava TaxID=871742 RepID=A0A562PIN3_9BURK|nr:fatty acid desaturase [Pseudoduganella flava]QGZ41926.1 acyl-CoA desaturase [Pseudoduganella flava]TWI44335.1 stearoyl-CoA desaturase (delta-9 desaturase) [Pseudoduganella flava]